MIEPAEQVGEVVLGEVPLEGLGDLVVVLLERVQDPRELGGVVEGVGDACFAFDDRVLDLASIASYD